MALRFPHLALDLLTRGIDSRRRRTAAGHELPIVISDTDPRKPRVLDRNPAAARHGIRPGLGINAARALAEGLHVTERNREAETHALQSLAAWCYQYSSQVSIHTGRLALVLEIGASRRLLGTAEEIAGGVTQALQRLGYHAQVGAAPTPEAAQLAARLGLCIPDAAALSGLLRGLPLEQLELESGQQVALGKMGFQKTGELLRLPRKAVTRRLGPALTDYLDRLTGARPDPQTAWRPPDRFSSGLDLPSEVTSSEGLLFPLKRLIGELCGILRAGDHGVQEIHICLRLRNGGLAEQTGPAACARGTLTMRLGLQSPCREEARFMLLLRERLEHLRLPQPVTHVCLQAGRFVAFEARQDGLFDTGGQRRGSLEPLLERLQARLGREAVAGLRGVQDHRPEYSWSLRAPHEAADCEPMPHRPVWLLHQPRPCRIGEYRVLAGPERIETGWWDGRDCRRDYFVVRDAHGSTLWAYREYKPNPGWFIQGIFA